MPVALDGLNRAQEAAVTHADGPLVVAAGAGTGKTRTVVERFRRLVEQGLPAERILALTFSAPAATDLRERLEEVLEVPYEELHVETYHSFCLRLLQEEALEAGVDPFLTPMTPADRLALLLERLDDLSLRAHEIRGNPAPLLASFVSRIDRLKQEMISAAEYGAYAERLAREAASDAARARAARELEFARLYADHDRLMAERGALDHGDLVLRAFALLHERPHVRERVAGRFQHVLVDEFQETNFAEGMLLRLLIEEHHAVTVVGADDRFASELPDASVVRLERNCRSGRRILDAATAVAPGRLTGASGGRVRFWRCRSERAQAQAVAAEAEQLIAGGVPLERIAVLVRSVKSEGQVIASALEERAIPARTCGAAAYFQRAEVRDILAWLRALADPNDSGAVVRALSRPPVELRSVDVARLTQLARRRKLDMPSAVAAALEGPQLSEEGRDRARVFLRLYRSASNAFEDRRPDAFVLRLIERIGLRRQQVFATHADTVERLRNIAKLSELATAYMRREPHATARDFTRYLAAVAESGLREEEAAGTPTAPAVQVMSMSAARGLEFDHVFVVGLSASRMPGPYRPEADAVPPELLKHGDEPPDGREQHEAAMRRLLHLAMTRARKGLVLAWAEGGQQGANPRPSPFYEEAMAAVDVEEELFEEELFGPAEGLHSTFRIMRDELLDTVARMGGRLGEMRLDTYLDVDQAVSRYLELIKVAALIERAKEGQSLDAALPAVNEILLQCATPEQREILAQSALDNWLRDTERDPAERPASAQNGSEPSLDPFIPRRGRGLMLSASDIDTYRICPLKYKFARVFRIPQEPTIHQRFGIVLHQVLERFHSQGGGSLGQLRELFEASWRRSGFGDSDDEQQFRARAVAALEDYWRRDRESDSEAVWFERSFAFRIGPHLLRGRVDRVDRHPDGTFELIDYKTGRAKTEEELREDVQLSVYQMGARESWGLETSAQSYFYVLTGEKVPVAHSDEELERVRSTVEEIGAGILKQRFEPTPSPEICRFCDYRIICPAAEK
ncbi:MAG TPA: ATP-dependent DNA helicase [Thermoleophilaceae bacterium]|nr:ATP-dependent DNA helicase [Thermoleophilaceae bacterium]